MSQLKEDQIGIPPALYEGQTFRSVYTRSKQHVQAYLDKKADSWMVQHAEAQHQGIVGGKGDFKLAITDKCRDNLTRQCGEGVGQATLEGYQQLGKVKLLNSKLDFNRLFLTSITVSRRI